MNHYEATIALLVTRECWLSGMKGAEELKAQARRESQRRNRQKAKLRNLASNKGNR